MIRIILISTLFSFIVASCKKSTCHYAAEPPVPLLFQIYKNGRLITDSSFLSSLKLSYTENNEKKYASQFGLLVGTDSDIFYKNGVLSANVGLKTAIKNYTLEYPDTFSSPDILFIDFLPPSPETNCRYKLSSALFNGNKTPMDTLAYQLIYIFNK